MLSQRRRRVLQQQPQQLPASLMQACRTLVMGVGLGFTGLVLDPVKGVHEDGVEGFFKGVGKGILGLLTKPAGGVVDMVSMAFDGLRRSELYAFSALAFICKIFANHTTVRLVASILVISELILKYYLANTLCHNHFRQVHVIFIVTSSL